MLTHLDLFSGIGGFALAAQWAGFRTVGFCEREPYAQQVLVERFNAEFKAEKMPRDLLAYTKELQRNGCKHHAGSNSEKHGQISQLGNGSRPLLHPDIFTLNGADYAGVDLLTGGFPCQPFSVAGKRLGAADDRAIWPQMLRVIDEARPAWVLGENVAGIINMELDNVLSQLEAIGYAAWPLVVPACAVDAKHRRDRVWIVAHAARELQHWGGKSRNGSGQHSNGGEAVANAASQRRQGQGEHIERCSVAASRQGQASDVEPVCQPCQWGAESGMGGVADELSGGMDGGFCLFTAEPQDIPRVARGVKHRAHRLRGLGNAIVPQVAFQIIQAIRSQIKP